MVKGKCCFSKLWFRLFLCGFCGVVSCYYIQSYHSIHICVVGCCSDQGRTNSNIIAVHLQSHLYFLILFLYFSPSVISLLLSGRQMFVLHVQRFSKSFSGANSFILAVDCSTVLHSTPPPSKNKTPNHFGCIFLYSKLPKYSCRCLNIFCCCLWELQHQRISATV